MRNFKSLPGKPFRSSGSALSGARGRQKKHATRYSRKASGTPRRSDHPLSTRPVSYEKLAGGLAFEMAESVRSRDAREFYAPFELVIVDPQGTVVFRCEISEDGEVRRDGPAQMVSPYHFPATALLTDRTLLTRTFQIDQAGC